VDERFLDPAVVLAIILTWRTGDHFDLANGSLLIN
jgi:hypothetical protein